MTNPLPERDWKYLRSIKAELLSTLCLRINLGAAKIVLSDNKSEHEKYHELFKYIEASDRIVADCFNDWRRSTLRYVVPLLRRHDLLTDEHIGKMSDETRELLAKLGWLAEMGDE